MKALAITHKGTENITSLEINELIKTKTEIKETCVIFEPKKIEDIALVCYKTQSSKKILYLIDNFKIKSLEDIKNSILKNKEEIESFLNKGKTFAVRCLHIENNEFDKEEICIESANSLKTKKKVNLDNPDIIIFVYIYKDECYIGIDFSGEDLSKREYRIYVHHEALKSSLYYSLLRVAEYKKNDLVLDSFCGSGTILIEAALFSNNISPNFYSKDKFAFSKFLDIDLEKYDSKSESSGKLIGYDIELRHVIAAKKNAKIAGIDKSINFSRVELEFIDTKLKEKSIDKIITHPPNKTHRNERTIEKVYDLFFNKANYVLKDKGIIAMITKTYDLIKNSAEKNKFNILKERDLIIGEENYKIIIFKR